VCKILYFDGISGSVTLRAVVPIADLKSLLPNDLRFIGDSYSELITGRQAETFIEVTTEEQQAECRAGFYSAGARPLEFEGCLRALGG